MDATISRRDESDYQLISSGTPYRRFESSFVSAIVGAAFLSALSVILLIVIILTHPRSHLGDRTHIPALFGSLIVSNLIQSIGTILNIRWVVLGRVSPGTLCSLQGGIKQAGNVGTAVWSFALALHAFCLLFLRTHPSTRSKWITLALGWTFIAVVVSIGPLVIQNKALGPYFGPSGYWCWITEQYPVERTSLEYMPEWMSALFSFVIYAIVLLRVRGNLIHDTAGKWSLQWIPRSESWRLGFVRDYLDSCTVKLAAITVWYPVTYTVLIVPMSIARFASYADARLSHGFVFSADLIFALGGFANFLLFLGTRRFIPDVDTVPDFSTPRTRLDKTSSRILGISPFVLTPKPKDLDVEAKPRMVPVVVAAGAICASPDEEAFVSYPDEAKEADTGTETLNPRA